MYRGVLWMEVRLPEGLSVRLFQRRGCFSDTLRALASGDISSVNVRVIQLERGASNLHMV